MYGGKYLDSESNFGNYSIMRNIHIAFIPLFCLATCVMVVYCGNNQQALAKSDQTIEIPYEIESMVGVSDDNVEGASIEKSFEVQDELLNSTDSISVADRL